MVKKMSSSTTCALESCSRTVRYDNPTAPYCSYHVGMKVARSSFSELASDPVSMAVVRDTLYNPRRSLIPRAAMSVGMLAAGSKLPGATVAKVYRAWNRASEGVDHDDPEQSLAARGRINDALSETFTDLGYRADVARCTGGLIRLPDTGYRPTADHEVLLVELDQDRLIVDGATSAPLAHLTSAVSKLFPSGESTTGDGLYIAQPFEYGAFSSVTYDTIAVGDEPIWSTPRLTEDSEVATQRALVSDREPVFPPVVYHTAPVDDNLPAGESTGGEPTLEELLDRR